MFCLTGKSNHNGQFKSKILFQKVFIILILNLEKFFFFFFFFLSVHKITCDVQTRVPKEKL